MLVAPGTCTLTVNHQFSRIYITWSVLKSWHPGQHLTVYNKIVFLGLICTMQLLRSHSKPFGIAQLIIPCPVFCWRLLLQLLEIFKVIFLILLVEGEVFSIGGYVFRTQVSPARWGLQTILRAINTESLTQYDWLLSSMNTEVSNDDAEDYSVSFKFDLI